MPSITAEVTTEVTIEFEAYCAKCGAGVCHTVSVGRTNRRGYPYIEIEPCENCIENAKEEGRDEVRETS